MVGEEMTAVPARRSAAVFSVTGTGRLLAGAGARVVILPLTGAAAIAVNHTVAGTYDLSGFATFSLVAALPYLIPQPDFGLGAQTTNAAAVAASEPRRFLAVYRTTRGLLWFMAAIIAAVAVLIETSIGLCRILNLPDSGGLNLGITLSLVIFAFSVPGSIGARILVGFKMNTQAIIYQAAGPLFAAGYIVVLASQGAPLWVLLLGPSIGVLLSAWATTCAALLSNKFRAAIAQVDCDSRDRNFHLSIFRSVWRPAVWMTLIALSTPLLFQMDRVILSWVSTVGEIGMYAAAAIFYLPALSVIQVGARSLWGDFAASRGTAESRRLLLRSITLMVLLGSTIAVVYVFAGLLLTEWIVGSAVNLSWPLFVAFGVLLIVQAFHQPSGMYLTDGVGLRFQAKATVAAALVSLPLAITFAYFVGAWGPVVATAVALLLVQAIPCFYFAKSMNISAS